jgi:hypothetical protein
MNRALLSLAIPLVLLVVSPATAAPSDDGATQISVQTNGGNWRVIGAKRRFEFNPTNLACRVETPGNAWQMRVSSDGDLRDMQDMMLPKTWPEKTRLYDTSCFGRGLYQPWWGHERGGAAMLVILETPDDAGCQFDHPAGGPTTIGPRCTTG